ncbi:MAG TPA: hypothetical protein DCM87_14975 [Planctomycetes bacterium]|nr:hypothetical protein [Planctomycetota bacterium]
MAALMRAIGAAAGALPSALAGAFSAGLGGAAFGGAGLGGASSFFGAAGGAGGAGAAGVSTWPRRYAAKDVPGSTKPRSRMYWKRP